MAVLGRYLNLYYEWKAASAADDGSLSREPHFLDKTIGKSRKTLKIIEQSGAETKISPRGARRDN